MAPESPRFLTVAQPPPCPRAPQKGPPVWAVGAGILALVGVSFLIALKARRDPRVPLGLDGGGRADPFSTTVEALKSFKAESLRVMLQREVDRLRRSEGSYPDSLEEILEACRRQLPVPGGVTFEYDPRTGKVEVVGTVPLHRFENPRLQAFLAEEVDLKLKRARILLERQYQESGTYPESLEEWLEEQGEPLRLPTGISLSYDPETGAVEAVRQE